MTRIDRHSTAWYEALDVFVQERGPMPFMWGMNDCCTLAADWVLAVRGDDPMSDLRGIFSAREALQVLQEETGLLSAVTRRMGEPVAGTMAQVGDVALVRHGGDRLSMGVCLGAFVAAPGDAGLLMVPIDQAEAAWRV